MEVLFSFVICMCINLSVANIDTYRAGVINSHDVGGLSGYLPLIHDAGKSQVDILVLPSPDDSGSEDNYDETVKELSKAAKEASLYIVAHLVEKTRQSRNELVRSNLVFDREGAIVSVYRKSINNLANCTTPSSDITTFTTDFGVTFGLLMEEDIVLHNVDQSLKNYVVTGTWLSEIPFLSAAQFSSSWAHTNNVNLVSNAGIYSGISGLRTASDKLSYAVLQKSGDYESSILPVINPTNLRTYPDEDLSQYIIRPLDLTASSQGYKETVCHNKFCCEFYVKTSLTGMKQEPNYGFVAFDGIRYFGRNHHIGTQNCAVFACAGLYKRTCAFGSENSTNVIFDKITITANFTIDNTAQYPAIITTNALKNNNFKFETTIGQHKLVSTELTDSSVLTFGINGRDFSRDYEAYNSENKAEGLTLDIYEYLYNEDVKEFFDYVWIRLRILILVVSIYILEML